MTHLPMIQATTRRRLGACALALCVLAAVAPWPAMAQGAGVEAAVEQLRLLMVDPDRARLNALVSEQLSYGHSGGKVDSKASFIGELLDGTSDFASITLADQTITTVGDVATVRHVLSGATQDAGKPPGAVKLHVLTVWVRQGGGWQLLARQAVRLP